MDCLHVTPTIVACRNRGRSTMHEVLGILYKKFMKHFHGEVVGELVVNTTHDINTYNSIKIHT